MAEYFKVVTGDVRRQRVVLRERTKVKGVGKVNFRSDIKNIRVISQKRKVFSVELELISGHRIVGETTQRGLSFLSRYGVGNQTPKVRGKSSSMLSTLVGASVLAVLVVVGGIAVLAMLMPSDSSSPPDSMPSRQVGQHQPARVQPDESKSSLPSFEVLASDRVPPYKASFDVRLEHPLEMPDLTRIAESLKTQSGDNIEKVFISYYLPGMSVGAGAWATSHWDPSLTVRILGLSFSQLSDTAIVEQGDIDGSLIGRWVHHAQGCVVFLVQAQDSVVVVRRFGDKSELVEKVQPSGDRYLFPDGAYLVVDSKGYLDWFDEYGFVGTSVPFE